MVILYQEMKNEGCSDCIHCGHNGGFASHENKKVVCELIYSRNNICHPDKLKPGYRPKFCPLKVLPEKKDLSERLNIDHVRALKMNHQGCYFDDVDGTMYNLDGSRSIFDDVDK